MLARFLFAVQAHPHRQNIFAIGLQQRSPLFGEDLVELEYLWATGDADRR